MSTERTIHWYEDADEAKKVSAESGKPILMFFHSVHCAGCLNTFEKTLRRMSVVDSINDHFVPLVFEVSEMPKFAEHYNIEWTPTFIVADMGGHEHYRWEGYLPEDDYLAHVTMGLARLALKKGEYKEAERRLDEMLIKFPLSDLAAEASYYLGVAKYRGSQDSNWLLRTYEEMKTRYPDSVWTIKASVFTKEDFKRVEESLRMAA